MKTKTRTACSFAAGMLALALIAAESPIDLKKRDPDAGPTVISSDRMEFDYKDFIALFEGSVKVKDPQFSLSADKMLVFFENTNDVKRVDAVGNVYLVSGDMTATCGKASYTAKNGTVAVQSNPGEPMPIVTKGENRITGELMTIWLNEELVVVEKKVTVVVTPEKQ